MSVCSFVCLFVFCLRVCLFVSAFVMLLYVSMCVSVYVMLLVFATCLVRTCLCVCVYACVCGVNVCVFVCVSTCVCVFVCSNVGWPVAFEWFVRLMAPGMGLQVGELAEWLVAVRIFALVRLLAGVRPQVLLKVGQLRELKFSVFIWLDRTIRLKNLYYSWKSADFYLDVLDENPAPGPGSHQFFP